MLYFNYTAKVSVITAGISYNLKNSRKFSWKLTKYLSPISFPNISYKFLLGLVENADMRVCGYAGMRICGYVELV